MIFAWHSLSTFLIEVGVSKGSPSSGNSDPEGIDFPIPGNDDARRSIDLYCSLIKETIENAKKTIPKQTEEKLMDEKNNKRKIDKTKTILEADREKLDAKFSKKNITKLN